MNFSRLALAAIAFSSIVFPASAEESETWKSIGTGTFREEFLHAFYAISQYPELEVEIEESEQTPGRYRLVNPYQNYPDFIGSPGCYPGDYYVIIDASDPVHVFIETTRAGYQSGGNEMLIVGSLADDYYNNRYGDWILADAENRCGKLVDNIITFPPNSLLASNWNRSEEWVEGDDILWKICGNGMFRVKLPGAPDLDVTTVFDGLNDSKTELLFTVTLGSSVEKARAAFYKGNDTTDIGQLIVNGDIPSVEVPSDGSLSFPYEADGIYTLAIVPYWEDQPRTFYTYTKTTEFAFDESEWRKAGQALYREGIISGVEELREHNIIYPTHEYYVEVEENVQKPGYIRLVDPYGDACPLSSGYEYDHSRRWYLYIDASDPDMVFIEKADEIGLDLDYGPMSIWSRANRLMDGNDPDYIALWTQKPLNYTPEMIAAKAREYSGTFYNDEITFPVGSLSIQFLKVNPGTWYTANSKGDFSIKFAPGQLNGIQSSGIGTVGADLDENAPAIYYRLDGSLAPAGELTPGLYIVRQGSKAFKTVVK